jgi:site-specific DNA recombinase
MKENASRGYFNGGTVPVGYRTKRIIEGTAKKTKLEPDPTYTPVVKRVFQMCIEGMGAKEIVKTLNSEGLKTNRGKPWTVGTIHNILKNENYTGTLVWNRKSRSGSSKKRNPSGEVIRVKKSHPAIIPWQTFDKVQRILEDRDPKIVHPRSHDSRYLLSGLLFCGKCGSRMVGAPAKSSTYFYYLCGKYKRGGKSLCAMRPLGTDKVESFVIDRIRDNILTEENLTELVRLTAKEVRQNGRKSKARCIQIDKQLAALRKRLNRLYDCLETGKIDTDDISPRIKGIKGEISDLEAQRVEAERQMEVLTAGIIDESEVKAQARDLRNLLSKGSIIEQKSFLKTFIQKVSVNRSKVVIDYTLDIARKGAQPITQEVLPLKQVGSPDKCLKARSCGILWRL